MTRVGTGYRYTDLEKLRIEYWVRETDMTIAEMAAALRVWVPERTVDGLEQHLWRRGISLLEERGVRPATWCGV